MNSHAIETENIFQSLQQSLKDEEIIIGDHLPNDFRDPSSLLTQATIMMVEDEETTADLMQGFLEESGYQRFVLLEHSSPAIAQIEKVRPDLLLLNLIMPEVSGFEILQQVRAHPQLSHLPVIILTSSLDGETKLKALDYGATDFLAKPVDPSELTLRVRNTLAARAYHNQLVYYDPLTKLPNQSLLLDRLAWFLQRAERQKQNLVMFHITLENFKRVYHNLDPQVGNQVILQISERISSCIRISDTFGHRADHSREVDNLFRVGSDEFSLVCPGMDHAEHAIKLASRILKVMEQPLNAADTEVYIRPCIGISTYPVDAMDMTKLIQCAVGASTQVAGKGNGVFNFYSSALNNQGKERMQLEADLRRAIEDKQLILHYQPQVNVQSAQIKGVEALVRWQKPDGETVFPDRFIPLAEETGLILPLGEWVLHEACAQWARWQAQGITLQVSVNLSAKQFHANNLVQIVKDTLKRHDMEGHYLVLELTESVVMDKPEQAVGTLEQLINLGVKLAIDDFGTGYSSLSYLKRFPLHELKIDRSFLKDMTNDQEDHALVSAIIYLAHEFNLNVVAEGVETQEQLTMLASLNCDEYQGYFFSRPVSAQDLAPLLETHVEVKA